MRHLTPILCLLLPIALGSLVGCRHTHIPSPYTLMIGKDIDNLPQCENLGQSGICGGMLIWNNGYTSGPTLGVFTYGTWKNGKQYGNMTHTVYSGGELSSHCSYTVNSNGKKEGWETCKGSNDRLIGRKFYVNGVESLQKAAEQQQATYFQKCQEIGFKPKTDKFSDCVLRLMEMQSNNHPQTVIQNNTGDSSAVRALLEEQKNQRQLEGSLEMMKRGLEMMKPTKPALTCTYNAYTKTTVCN